MEVANVPVIPQQYKAAIVFELQAGMSLTSGIRQKLTSDQEEWR